MKSRPSVKLRSGIANISGLFGGDQGYELVREQQQQVNCHSALSLTMNIKVCSNIDRHFFVVLVVAGDGPAAPDRRGPRVALGLHGHKRQ